MAAVFPLSIIKPVLSALYPPRCLCCGTLICERFAVEPSAGGAVDRGAVDRVAVDRRAAAGGAVNPEPFDGESPLCGACLASWRAERAKTSGIRADGVLYLAQYTKGRSVARTLVLSAKHSNEHRLYIFLARELAGLLGERAEITGCAVNVPRSSEALRATGVDQAKLLAKAFAAATGTLYIGALRHRRLTAAQKTLGASERYANAASAYTLDRKAARYVSGRTVILIDDVATTGSTLSACESLLREAGAVRVIKVAVASSDKKV